ncbi:MAG: diguanylate cyclase [Acholeplasmatales bacterium]|nr:MAG: diguanylate cyclase [Acholeplasmatales bacterium]
MFDPLSIALFGSWFFLLVLKRLRMKSGDLDTLFFVLALGGRIVFGELQAYPVETWIIDAALYAGIAYTLLFFSLNQLFDRDESLARYQALSKEHKHVLISHESLRKRFISLIELLKEGLIFRNHDGTLFVTEPFLTMTGHTENECSAEDHDARIHPEDRDIVQTTLKKLNRRHPRYNITYRYKKSTGYVWLKERGILVYYEDRRMIISLVQSIDVRMHPASEVDLLNTMKFNDTFYEALQEINRRRQPYHLVFFELSNIPLINQQYGRDFGDLMMGEFLNKMTYHFLKDDRSLFRISGIRFAMIVRDERKYEILERALKHGGDLLNFEMHFGRVQETVFPHFGMQKVTVFEEPIDEVIKRSNRALDIAKSEESPDNYFKIT